MEKKEQITEKIKELPEKPGVYIMKDSAGHEIYVGKAKNLKRRVSSYFQRAAHDDKTTALIDKIDDFEYIITESDVDALILESQLIKDFQPKYNIELKHREGYPFLEITREDFPQVLVSYRQEKPDSKYIGPFVDVTGLRSALRHLKKIFRFRSCTKAICADDKKLRFNRPCLRFYLGQCKAPCSGRVSKKEYREQIKKLTMFLNGKKTKLLRDLRHEMEECSDAREYERASEIRDQIQAIESLSRIGALDDALETANFSLDFKAGGGELRDVLNLSEVPRRIEGIDISNISGQDSVGSVVTFIDGVPFKDGYRRFRIKSVEGVDDYAMMREVVRRRYKKLVKDDDLPDVVLIDGGLGHLHAALESFAAALGGDKQPSEITRPSFLGLAKKREQIFLPGVEEPLSLPATSGALRLLQRVRDEAHRFAQVYHHLLHRKRTFGAKKKK